MSSPLPLSADIAFASVSQGRLLRYLHLAYWSFRENALLVGLTFLYSVTSLAIRQVYGLRPSPFEDWPLNYISFAAGLAVSLFCSFTIWFFYSKRIKCHPGFEKVMLSQVRDKYLTAPRLVLAAPMLLTWPLFFSTFSYLKALISTFKPFYLDAALAEWDRRLHFGFLPNEWLDPVFGHVVPVFILNWVYTIWFLIIMAVFLLQSANTENRRLRAQYLLTQALLWPLLGNVLATLLSSAGPCYFGLLNAGANPYADQMARLDEMAESLKFSILGYDLHVPIMALRMQEYLWNGYLQSSLELGQGISASPSLHVASTWLVARLCWAYGPKAGLVGFSFLVLIFIGSIELGWHYAIDGYLGILGAWLCWRLAGLILSLRPVKRLLWGASQEADPAGLTAG